MEEPYYLANFQCVLQDVGSRCGDLLLPAERERTEAFLRLPSTARRLYVRMLTRKGPWFRPETLDYPEVEDAPAALGTLLETGFCAGAEAAGAADLAALLLKGELETLLREAGLRFRRADGRPALAGRILAEVPEAVLRARVRAFSPLGLDWARLVFALFFGNLEQNLTDFVLADLGHVRYEDYPVDPGCRLFRSRADVDGLFALEGLREALEAGADLAVLTDRLRALERNPAVRLQRRRQRLLNEVGRAWERRGAWEEALACFRASGMPPSRERMIRIHLARGERREAADAALAMAGAPADAGEERLARRFLLKLAKEDPRAAAWAEAHPPDPPAPALRLHLPRHPSGSVEQAALAASGWAGFHTENILWNALYGLAFWDVLFAPIPGAFQHRFQWGPADLRTPDFFERRRDAIAARLEELAQPGAPFRLILATAEAKRGLANAFVHWPALPPEHLEAALAVLPQRALLAVLATMAPDPWGHRSGFPDLFLHREGRCKVWEVKGPGDALRPEQERWLGVFNRAGLEASVAWVTYEDAPKTGP